MRNAREAAANAMAERGAETSKTLTDLSEKDVGSALEGLVNSQTVLKA